MSEFKSVKVYALTVDKHGNEQKTLLLETPAISGAITYSSEYYNTYRRTEPADNTAAKARINLGLDINVFYEQEEPS